MSESKLTFHRVFPLPAAPPQGVFVVVFLTHTLMVGTETENQQAAEQDTQRVRDVITQAITPFTRDMQSVHELTPLVEAKIEQCVMQGIHALPQPRIFQCWGVKFHPIVDMVERDEEYYAKTHNEMVRAFTLERATCKAN